MTADGPGSRAGRCGRERGRERDRDRGRPAAGRAHRPRCDRRRAGGRVRLRARRGVDQRRALPRGHGRDRSADDRLGGGRDASPRLTDRRVENRSNAGRRWRVVHLMKVITGPTAIVVDGADRPVAGGMVAFRVGAVAAVRSVGRPRRPWTGLAIAVVTAVVTMGAMGPQPAPDMGIVAAGDACPAAGAGLRDRPRRGPVEAGGRCGVDHAVVAAPARDAVGRSGHGHDRPRAPGHRPGDANAAVAGFRAPARPSSG